MIVANFMDSSLLDLRKKGVFDGVGETYNPRLMYDAVLHFTPHAQDMVLAPSLADSRIELVLHPVHGLQPRKILATIIRIARLLRHRHVDIVRGRLPYLGSLMGVIAAHLVGCPSVVSLGGDNRIVQERNNAFYLGSRRLSYGIEWLTLALADRIIVPNAFTARYVAKILGNEIARKKCVTIPWLSPPVPADDSQDAARLAEFGITKGEIVVPIIGFVNRYKYSDVIFDALSEGAVTGPDNRPACFFFIGDGPLRQAGEERFRGRSDVRFVGWQDRAVVQAFLRRADLVLIPMSGFVLLEAASLGKLIVSSKIEWHSEVIRDGETGFLVDPSRSEAWRSAITHAVQEAPERRMQMADKLRNHYAAELDLSVAIEKEAALYASLVGKTANYS